MSKKVKEYIDVDVLAAAKNRIRHVIDIFDSLLVAFSGGKDSLVTLNLVQEVYDELGIGEKVKVFFRDEELIPDAVIDFVDEIYKSGKYDFRYYAIPLRSNKYILGKTYEYVQWDSCREWLRQPPEYAIRDESGTVYDQYTADTFICSGERGKVAIISGIRCDESLVRLRAIYNKKNECYISHTNDKRISSIKPIYDWSEKDVFLYMYQKGIRYCEIYDAEMWNRQNLRVATPLHAEASKRFDKLRTLYPKYYQQLVDLFPEMLVQGRYYDEYDADSQVIESYEHSLKGILEYIDNEISDKEMRALAIRRVKSAYSRRCEKLEGSLNLGGYPLRHIFRQVIKGNIKREILPLNTPTLADFKYEGLGEREYKRMKDAIR